MQKPLIAAAVIVLAFTAVYYLALRLPPGNRSGTEKNKPPHSYHDSRSCPLPSERRENLVPAALPPMRQENQPTGPLPSARRGNRPSGSQQQTSEQILARFAAMEERAINEGVNQDMEAYRTPIKQAIFSQEIATLEEKGNQFAIASGCFTANEGYIRGVMALGYSLKHVAKTRLRTVVLVTEACMPFVPLLEIYWDLIVPIKPFDETYGEMYQKFKAFLLPFERVVWMGADSIALRNFDHVVLCNVPCGVLDMAITVRVRQPPKNGKMENLKYSYYPHPAINGDFIVFKPSREQYDRLIAYISTELFLKNQKEIAGFWGPKDQMVLNEVIPHWTILPFYFSVETELLNEDTWTQFWDCCQDSFLTMHFAGPAKPWLEYPPATNLTPSLVWRSMEEDLVKTLPKEAQSFYCK